MSANLFHSRSRRSSRKSGPSAEGLEPRTLLSSAPIGPEFGVNQTTDGDQGLPAIASDGEGDFVVVWQGNGPGDVDGIFARRYAANGAAVSGEFRVNGTATNSQINPSVAMSADGDFVVAWQSFGHDGSAYGIYARRYNAAGAPQSNEFQVNTTTANNQARPSLAMDAAGDFVIAWESYGQDGSGYGVYARRYNAAGTPQSGEIPVNTTIDGNQDITSVAMDTGGDFVIAWQSYGQDGSAHGVYARRFGANDPPTTVGIAAINAVENGSPTTIALPTLFADSTDPTSALNYSVTDDTNPFLFSSTVIDSSGLTLNYGLNAIGSGSLTLTATDSGGLKVGASSPSPFAHHG